MVQVQVIGSDMIEGWVKYRIQIGTVFKRSSEVRLRRGIQHNFWLPNQMVICKCPKLKVGRRYLLMGIKTNILKIFMYLLFRT